MNETILLIEDDENDVFFLKRAMKLAGMINPLQVASDGRQAMDYLGGMGTYSDRERFPLPMLILLDLKLPLVMGLEVLKWIRQQPELRTIIVLILTSSKAHTDIQTAYSLGANSYLVKPSEPRLLAEQVNQIKKYWIDMNHCVPATAWVASPTRNAKVLQSVLY